MPYIYKITNKVNGKIYIGKTVLSVQKRWSQHCIDCGKEDKSKRPLYSAMRKYGIESFYVEQVEECPEEILSDRERYWIEYYGSFKNGYNATIGGDGKAYIDRQLVTNLYKEYQNIKTVSELMGVNYFTVRNILVENHVQIVPHYQPGTGVIMLDKYNGSPIKAFSSYIEAATYLVDNGLSSCGLSGLGSHISDVCKGRRKSAAGFKWMALN